jgi:hypothetical protein
MKKLIGFMLLAIFLPVACYNTYYINNDQLKKLERSDQPSVEVTDKKGRELQIKETSKLFVRSKRGKRYQLTPFNFKLTSQQLVASDRDYILDVKSLKPGGEIDVPSIWKNALLIGGGVAVVAGLILGMVFTSGTKSFH